MTSNVKFSRPQVRIASLSGVCFGVLKETLFNRFTVLPDVKLFVERVCYLVYRHRGNRQFFVKITQAGGFGKT